ncbi:MAG TPA: oligosaccharide flippase family protein [Hanamia sp.]|nr:oligosaccharide flippase family protein [Hanamia sp.]
MKRKFLDDISVNSLQVIINQACGLAIFYVISVYFSKTDFGEINWSLAVLLTAFIILTFGIDQVIVKKIAAGEDPKLMFSVYFLHALIAGGLFYSSLLIVYFFFQEPLQNHYLLLLLLGIGKLMIFFSSPFKQTANGLEKFKALFYMSVCSNVVRGTALILFAFFSKLNLTLVILIFITDDTAELLLSAFITKRFLKTTFSFALNKKIYLNLLKESMPQAGVVVFTSAIARLDWILLGILASNIALAEYSFAFKVFEVATLPLLIIAPILIPRFTRLFHTNSVMNSVEKINDLFVLFRFEIIIASLVSLILNILWIPVIDFITQGKYGLVNRYTILILSACMPFLYFNNFLWTINFAKGFLKMIFYFTFISFVINVIGDILLIPPFGGEGAAVSYFIAMFVQFILFWIKTDLPVLKENKLLFLPPIAALAIGILTNFTFGNTWLILISSLFFYFLILFFGKVLCGNDWVIFKRITGI